MKQTSPKSHRSALFSLAFPFYISVFLSAFLLFQVQPLIGKYILPWFGGGSSVWTTTILFFELLLLFGYGYAYFVTKLKLRQQIMVHAGLVLVAAGMLSVLFFFWSSPITPPLSLRPPDSFTPVLQVLSVLLLSVGLPYFLLSTTTSLLQRWFTHTKFNLSPYPLYALSNAGSLLGLLAYPFFIEVVLTLRMQGLMWSGLYLLLAVLLVASCYVTLMYAKKGGQTKEAAITPEAVAKKRSLLWLFFPMASSMILLSVTSQITQGIAPFPLLWVLPLSLYLLSFILCFSNKNLYWRNFYAILFIVSAAFSLYISLELQSIIMNISVYAVFIFASFMVLHGELYNSRPEPHHLNLFYFIEALGSVVGGIFVAVIAPLIFTDYWEFYLAIFLTYIVAILVLFTYKTSILYIILNAFPVFNIQKNRFRIGAVVAAGVIAFAAYYVYSYQGETLKKTRNFYGIVSVTSELDGEEEYLTMYNGRINHGGQYTSDDLRSMPVSYFGPDTGIAKALTLHPNRKEGEPLRIAVTGLGVGTIAAFGEEGDTIRFFEINQSAIEIAQNNFTFLNESAAEISIVPGDARISMLNELNAPERPTYDIIVLDAFVDDAIPVHLITKDAFDIYLPMLEKSQGVIAVNISNRYLSLEPVIAKLAEHFGMEYAVIDSDDGPYNVASATWVLLSYNKEFINQPDVAGVATPVEADLSKTHLWTDDYSNLLEVIYIY